MKKQMSLLFFFLVFLMKAPVYADQTGIPCAENGYALTLPSEKWKKIESSQASRMLILEQREGSVRGNYLIPRRYRYEPGNFFLLQSSWWECKSLTGWFGKEITSQVGVVRCKNFNSGNTQSDWEMVKTFAPLCSPQAVVEKGERKINGKTIYFYIFANNEDEDDNLQEYVVFYFIPGTPSCKDSFLIECYTYNDKETFENLKADFDFIADSFTIKG